MNGASDHTSPTPESLKAQLTELNSRSRWYAAQIWQLPFAYLGGTGIFLAQLVGKNHKVVALATIASGVVGLFTFWHLRGILNGVRRAVDNLKKVEEQLGLRTTAEWTPWYVWPLLIMVMFAAFSYLVVGFYLVRKTFLNC